MGKTGKLRSVMKYLISAIALVLALAGCNSNKDAPASHDRSYRAVEGGCILDEATGILWEVKRDQPGLRDWRNTYSWFNPNESHAELDYRGTPNGGQCAGSDCDTWDYVRAVNAARLCGYSDWRLPTRDELFSISDLRKAATPPTVNLEVFPHTQANEYWAGNDYSFQFDAAWAWNFYYGHDRVDWKKSEKYVRLSRGEAQQLTPVKE